jgi:hypothetical protein
VGLIRIYFDEDAMDTDLALALRSRGVGVLTPLDAGRAGLPDREQLSFATANDSVLYTFNVSDFYALHRDFLASGQSHGGMILAPQQRFSIGEQLRRILRLRAAIPATAMRNRAEFLGRWG